jgi:hypothetical protein
MCVRILVSHNILKDINFGSTDNSSLSTICEKNWVRKTKVETQYIGSFIDNALKQTNVNITLPKHTENSDTKMDNVSAAQCRYCACPTPGATYPGASPVAAREPNEIRSCRGAVRTRFTFCNPPPANHGTLGAVHVTPANN